MDGVHFESVIIYAIIAACGWLAKTIIKPWSDAYLLRSQAFTTYVEDQGKRTAIIADESHKQTGMLTSIANGTNQQLATMNQINDAQKALCKAGDHSCQASLIGTILGNKLDLAVNVLGEISEYHRAAAVVLEKNRSEDKLIVSTVVKDVAKKTALDVCKTCDNYKQKDNDPITETVSPAKIAAENKKNPQ